MVCYQICSIWMWVLTVRFESACDLVCVLRQGKLAPELCTPPWRLVRTATRLSPVLAYGQLLRLYAATLK